MPMNRRGFLGSIAAFAAQCTLDPELALWKPGAKLISVPKPAVNPYDHIGDISFEWEDYQTLVNRERSRLAWEEYRQFCKDYPLPPICGRDAFAWFA